MEMELIWRTSWSTNTSFVVRRSTQQQQYVLVLKIAVAVVVAKKYSAAGSTMMIPRYQVYVCTPVIIQVDNSINNSSKQAATETVRLMVSALFLEPATTTALLGLYRAAGSKQQQQQQQKQFVWWLRLSSSNWQPLLLCWGCIELLPVSHDQSLGGLFVHLVVLDRALGVVVPCVQSSGKDF